jgi:hypothetical protein
VIKVSAQTCFDPGVLKTPHNVQRTIVSSNGSLRSDIEGTLTNINDIGQTVHQWNCQEPARLVHFVELSESFDNVLVALRHNVEYRVRFGNGPLPHVSSGAATTTDSIKNISTLGSGGRHQMPTTRADDG